MTSPLIFLQDSVKVKPAADGQVEVTLTLPSDLFLHFIRLLDSLSGIFRFVDRKSKLAQIQSAESLEKFAKQAQKNLAEYHTRLAESFDTYRSQGLVHIPTKSDHRFRRKVDHPFRTNLDQSFRRKLDH